MDRPKCDVFWLESFPPDIWAYFVQYLAGEQLGRMMMTGAKSLRRRLTATNVVRSIKLGRDYIVFDSCPGFLNEFPSLEELSICSPSNSWSDRLSLTIASIPSGVKKVELSGHFSLLCPLPGNLPDLKLNECLPRLETLHLYDLKNAKSAWKNSDSSWMTHSPQSLTNLSIRRWTGEVELPPSLLHFKADVVDLSVVASVSKLPPSLESFVAFIFCGVDLIVPLLPHSTRKFAISSSAEYVDGPICPRQLLEKLPKSLSSLRVPYRTDLNFETHPELTSLLPSTLTELKIEIPCSVGPMLPQNLTKLAFRMSNCTDAQPIQACPFDVLPRSLTRLDVLPDYKARYLYGAPASPKHSYFPPQLRCLKLPDIQLSPKATKLFPSSLTYLDIGNLCEKVCEHLPKGLETLIASRTLLSPNLIKFLPKTLTHLELYIFRDSDEFFDYGTGERIDCVSELLEYPVLKLCLSNGFDWNDSPRLPSTLTYLTLNDAYEIGDSFMAHQLLPNLRNLELDNIPDFSDLSIPLLSPQLMTLNLTAHCKVSGKSFKFLPRGLTSMNLSSSESIYDSDILHLPRTLKEAFLPNAVHLTDSCIPHLPPHLEKLDLSKNARITPSSLPKFPYPLRYSQLPCSIEFKNWDVSFGAVRRREDKKKKKVAV